MWQFLAVTITEKLKKYTDLQEEHTRILQLKTVYVMPLVLSKTTINQITREFKIS
jgi:hypothetical protein